MSSLRRPPARNARRLVPRVLVEALRGGGAGIPLLALLALTILFARLGGLLG